MGVEKAEKEILVIVSLLLVPAWEMTQPLRLLLLALEKSEKGDLPTTGRLWATLNRSDKRWFQDKNKDFEVR